MVMRTIPLFMGKLHHFSLAPVHNNLKFYRLIYFSLSLETIYSHGLDIFNAYINTVFSINVTCLNTFK